MTLLYGVLSLVDLALPVLACAWSVLPAENQLAVSFA